MSARGQILALPGGAVCAILSPSQKEQVGHAGTRKSAPEGGGGFLGRRKGFVDLRQLSLRVGVSHLGQALELDLQVNEVGGSCKSGAFSMGYSLRIPLPRGTLKIKSESRLRTRERNGEVPTARFLSTYFVWEPKASESRQTLQPRNGEETEQAN